MKNRASTRSTSPVRRKNQRQASPVDKRRAAQAQAKRKSITKGSKSSDESPSRRSSISSKRRKEAPVASEESSESSDESSSLPALSSKQSSDPPPEQRGRLLKRRALSTAAPPSRDPAPAAPVSTRSKRSVSVSVSPAPARDRRKKLRETRESDDEGSGSGDELIASPVLSRPKQPEKPAEPEEDGSDADDEDEGEDSDTSSRLSKRKLVRLLKKRPKPKPITTKSPDSSGGTAKEPTVPAKTSPRRSVRVPLARSKAAKVPTFPKTATVLQNHAADPVVMAQYGGGTGSNAGDAAVLTLRKSRRLFSLDFGGTKGQQTLADKRRAAARKAAPEASDDSDFDSESGHQGKGRDVGDNTHSHSDHIGKQTPKTVELFDRFWVGAAAPDFLTGTISKNQEQAEQAQEDGEEPEQNKVEQVSENGEILFSWVSKKGKIKRPDNPRLRVRARAILPDISQLDEDDTDENKRSTGALLAVDMIGKKTERVFTMLTLGDMTPKEGQAAVEEVWRDKDGSSVVNVVKMAHHGSDQNIAATPESVVTAGVTELIISGYTMKSTATLIKFIENTKPKKVLILFNDSEDAKAFNKLETAANLYTAAKKLGVGVEVAKDYVMAVSDSGKPSLEPTGW